MTSSFFKLDDLPAARYERKFLARDFSLEEVLSILRMHFAGFYRVYPARWVNSIYLDTSGLRHYHVHVSGVPNRYKVRVRWYRTGAGGATRTAFLEVKDRVGSARDKIRKTFEAPADLLENARLDDPRWSPFLLEAASALGVHVEASLAPTVSIRYRRFRMRCPVTGSRLSVDSEIECPRANSATIPFAGPLRCPFVVCEAKSDVANAWPFGPDLVRMGFRLRSFSKYGYFLEHLLDGGFR